MEHQRRFPRIPTSATVLVAQVDGREIDQFAKTRTVGLGGCGFVYGEPLVSGSIVELMIATRPAAIKTLARTVYSRPLGNGEFEIGVEFLALPPEHKRALEDLLQSRDESRG